MIKMYLDTSKKWLAMIFYLCTKIKIESSLEMDYELLRAYSETDIVHPSVEKRECLALFLVELLHEINLFHPTFS